MVGRAGGAGQGGQEGGTGRDGARGVTAEKNEYVLCATSVCHTFSYHIIAQDGLVIG